VRVTIRVKPGSSRSRVGGDHDGALVVAVTARAVDGKAPESALAGLADALGVRRRDVSLVTGATSRTKVVEVGVDASEADDLSRRVEELRAGPRS
jgi:hypothetical protein